MEPILSPVGGIVVLLLHRFVESVLAAAVIARRVVAAGRSDGILEGTTREMPDMRSMAQRRQSAGKLTSPPSSTTRSWSLRSPSLICQREKGKKNA